MRSFITLLASSLLLSSTIASPLSPSGLVVASPFLSKIDPNPSQTDFPAEVKGRAEYWTGIPFKRDNGGQLDPNCVETARGIFCTYSNAEVKAFGDQATELQEGCFRTTEGIVCAYYAFA